MERPVFYEFDIIEENYERISGDLKILKAEYKELKITVRILKEIYKIKLEIDSVVTI